MIGMAEIVLMSDPRVASLPALECGEPLVDVRKYPEFRCNARFADAAGIYAQLRAGLVERLRLAATLLPSGIALMIYEGRRPMKLQVKYFQQYADQLRRDNPDLAVIIGGVLDLVVPISASIGTVAPAYNRLPALLSRIDNAFPVVDGRVQLQLEVIVKNMPYLADSIIGTPGAPR